MGPYPVINLQWYEILKRFDIRVSSFQFRPLLEVQKGSAFLRIQGRWKYSPEATSQKVRQRQVL